MPCVEDPAGDEEARPGHEEWRDALDGVSDSEVGGTPDEVDDGEGEDDAPGCLLGVIGVLVGRQRGAIE
jgi:hypothetical protein